MKNLIEAPLFRRIYQKLTGQFYNVTYSQTGEDIIIDFLIKAKRVKDFTYLDIGANDPVKMNNTYKFYEAGNRGVCIEPDPFLFKRLSKVRSGDKCLNIGIAGTAETSADFYLMSAPVLNTFSKEEAEELQKNGHSTIKEVIKVPLQTVESVIDIYFGGKAPVFINLDVEGLDEVILRTFPFGKYRPYIFCIETVEFTDDASSAKRTEIMEMMQKNKYEIFADTYINTIFIDSTVKYK
ncbi:MAG: FkbM family methyltransferase [Bacteroidetes bacterium]|nr:FkbM family methyltransferase [Bacteroidota bacterium]